MTIPASTTVALTRGADSDSALLSASLARLGLAGHRFSKGALDPAYVEKAAKDFESLFIAQMVEQMFGESIGEEAFGDEESGEVYKNLMTQEYGKIIADGGGIGIASYVKTELLRLQEVGS
jgi:Rod binding domain-containing protein